MKLNYLCVNQTFSINYFHIHRIMLDMYMHLLLIMCIVYVRVCVCVFGSGSNELSNVWPSGHVLVCPQVEYGQPSQSLISHNIFFKAWT